jgi:NAD(P)-dependent dehydrogenase (short-subunit alcohol dehydrogenase family)
MRAAAMELGSHGVQVNAINPGMTVHERSPARYKPGEPSVEAYRHELLVGRLSEPADFAEFTFNLAQMKAVSGQVFNIDSRFLG